MGVERLKQESEDRLATLTAGSDGGPDSLAPEVADQPFGALSHFAVKYDATDLTFGRIVRRFQPQNPCNVKMIYEREV